MNAFQPFNLKGLSNSLEVLRQKNPLIVNVTNTVTSETIANVLLAIGASPIVTESELELEELLPRASALVLNMGTIDEHWVQLALKAQQIANQLKLLIVFDPVGAGATDYRTNIAREILENGVSVIRGNASEIQSLGDKTLSQTKGVDSTIASGDAVSTAEYIAKKTHCISIISGATDYVCTAETCYSDASGVPLMTKITGMGCALTAVIASFLAVNSTDITIVRCIQHAIAYYNHCAEHAAAQTNLPGTFKPKFIDVLSDAKVVQHKVAQHVIA